MAHEGEQKMPSTSSLNGNVVSNMEGIDMSGDHSSENGLDMEGMDMSDDHSLKDGHDMEGMKMEDSGHSHEPVEEKPANIKVLGTFGAVNLSFIVIGVWNKWFRRKDGSDGNSK